jgi:hypothetical protein
VVSSGPSATTANSRLSGNLTRRELDFFAWIGTETSFITYLSGTLPIIMQPGI